MAQITFYPAAKIALEALAPKIKTDLMNVIGVLCDAPFAGQPLKRNTRIRVLKRPRRYGLLQSIADGGCHSPRSGPSGH